MPPGAAHRRLLRHLLAALCLLLAAGAAGALESVTLQLKWQHQFQFAGYYMAQARGYYREAGLEVRIVEGRADTDPVAEVLAGRAQYGIGASELLLERSRGKPVVALAAVFQHSPLVLLARAGGPIRRPADLEGRRLMLLPTEAELFAFLRREQVKEERLQRVPHSFSAADLMAGKVDAVSGYLTDETYELEKAGFPYLSFSPRAANIDFYGDTLFTAEAHAVAHPQQVEAFRRASLQGWAAALADPDAAAREILQHYSTRHSLEHLLFEAERMRPLIEPALVELGHMSPARWRRIGDTYAELGMMPRDYAVETLLYRPAGPQPLPPWAWGTLLLAALALLAALYIHRLYGRLQGQMRQRDSSERNLRASREHLARIFETAPLAAIVYDQEARVLEWNHRAEEIFGWRREEMLGRSFFEHMVPEEARQQVQGIVDSIFRGPEIQYSLNRNLTRDGRAILCEWSNAILRDEAGGPPSVIALAADVTERERVRAALQDSEQRYRTLLETAPFPVVITRLRDSLVTYINQRAATCFQVPQEDAVGRHAPDYWVDMGQRQRLIEELRQKQVVTDMEVRLRDAAGQPFWALLSARILLEEQEPLAFVSFNNINERKAAEEALQALNGELAYRLQEINLLQARLQEQATRDALTGLYNRRYLDETLEREVARAQREGYPLAVALLDIDHFKQLNDTYGHRAGDEMLRQLGHFLQARARSGDVPCRYGGEEFLLVLPGMDLETARQRAEEWRAGFAGLTVNFGSLALQATLSVGVACYPGHGKSADALVDAADAALYRAKAGGRNRVEVAGAVEE